MITQYSDIKIVDRVLTRLKLKQLRLLVAIADHMSILHAANELHISQPAATKLLKDLEIDFNVKLFDRTNRGVVPTQYGRALVRHGKLILSQISHAAQELDDLNEGLGGRVVVGTLLTASAQLLPLTIKNIIQQRPKISISVKDGTNDLLMPMLQNGDVDMIVGRLTEFRHREQFTQEILFQEKVVVVAAANHPLTNKTKVSFRELTKYNWILPPPETTLRRQIDKEFFDQGFASPANAVECVSYLANRALLQETEMLSVLPLPVVEADIVHKMLKPVSCKLNFAGGSIGVSYRKKGELSPAAMQFLEELRRTAKKIQN